MNELMAGKTKCFRATGANGTRARTLATPRDAALAFFETNPKARKCNVIEGWTDGVCFTIVFGRASEGEWPQSWKDVTKRTAADLPEIACDLPETA